MLIKINSRTSYMVDNEFYIRCKNVDSELGVSFVEFDKFYKFYDSIKEANGDVGKNFKIQMLKSSFAKMKSIANKLGFDQMRCFLNKFEYNTNLNKAWMYYYMNFFYSSNDLISQNCNEDDTFIEDWANLLDLFRDTFSRDRFIQPKSIELLNVSLNESTAEWNNKFFDIENNLKEQRDTKQLCSTQKKNQALLLFLYKDFFQRNDFMMNSFYNKDSTANNEMSIILELLTDLKKLYRAYQSFLSKHIFC